MTSGSGAGDYLDALRCLPIVSPAELLAGRHLVVVAPHPDDESLGLGGLLAAAQAQGTGVTVIFMTDGEASHVGSASYPPARLGATRRCEARAALAALGIPASCARFLGLGDGRLAGLDGHALESARKRLSGHVPDTALLLCTTVDTDPHGDHRATAALIRGIPWPDTVTVMQFPVWTWAVMDAARPTAAPSGVRVDIGDFVDAKQEAIAAHRTQHGHVVNDAEHAFTLNSDFLAAFEGTMETLIWPT